MMNRYSSEMTCCHEYVIFAPAALCPDGIRAAAGSARPRVEAPIASHLCSCHTVPAEGSGELPIIPKIP
jgi:hypothetical protein